MKLHQEEVTVKILIQV